MRHDDERRLDNVLWIGGGTDAGKTSVATLLAERYGLRVYHFDRQEMRHFAQADPARHPALWQAHPDRMTTEERWLGAPPSAMARETIACWTERFWMAVDDLRAMPPGPLVVAEGPGLFPDCVATQIDGPRQAVFLVPAEGFKRAIALQRVKPGSRYETSDPGRATRQLIERDLLINRFVAERAAARGLRVIEADGLDDVDACAARVAEWFGDRLRQPAVTGGVAHTG